MPKLRFISLHNLAEFYRSQGNYSEVEFLYQRSLDLEQNLLGDLHPSVATSLNNLAFLLYKQNRYDDAEALFLQALKIFEPILGSNHPNTQTVKNSIAYLRTIQGKS